MAETPSALPVAPAGLESMVRSIVEQLLNEFVEHTLPDLIRQMVAKGGHHGGGSAGIQGNLESVRIVEVMQMLGLQRQTGRLMIKHAGEDVEVYFKDGSVVFASANHNGSKSAMEFLLRKSCRIDEGSIQHVVRIAEMTSEPIDRVLVREKLLDHKTFTDCLRRHTESTVYKIMAWQNGDFSFEKAPPPVFAVPVQLKVDDLLLEGARRADEWSLIQQKIPDFNIIFEPMIGNAEELTTRGMSATDMKVFSYINGKRTIQEIVDMLFLGEFDVAKSMFILMSVNLIRRKR